MDVRRLLLQNFGTTLKSLFINLKGYTINCDGPAVTKSGYDEGITWVSRKHLNYDVFNYVCSPMPPVKYWGTVLIKNVFVTSYV